MYKFLAKPTDTRAGLLAILALALMAALAAGALRTRSSGQTGIESRLERVLSAVEGAGRVHVLVNVEEDAGVLGNKPGRVIGVVIVASGADDPATVARLAHAAGVALDLEQQYIEVFRMEEGWQ